MILNRPKKPITPKMRIGFFLITFLFFVCPLGVFLVFPALLQEDTVFGILGGVALLISLFTSFMGGDC